MLGEKLLIRQTLSYYRRQRLLAVIALVALVTGVIPPPLVRTLLPSPVAELVEAALPVAEPVEATALAAPAAQAVMGNSVLTITKTVVGSGATGPFTLTVTGPGSYNNATTVSTGTPRVLSGLASGVYTVTESSPGAGWTTTYAVTSGTGTANSTNAVVTLQNSSSVTAFTLPALTSSALASDDFTGNNYTSGTGWSGNWLEEESNSDLGTSNGSAAGVVRVVSLSGNNAAQIFDEGRSLARSVTLPATSCSASLTFSYRRTNFTTAGATALTVPLLVEVAADGGTPYTTLLTLTNATTTMQSTTVNLPASGGRNVRLRWRVSAAINLATTEGYYVDNVAVSSQSGPLCGTVYRDYNSDGQITANGTITDTGVSGVTVTAYNQSGAAVGSATTNFYGSYIITPTAAGPYRVEFTTLPSGYEPSRRGPSAGSGTNGTSTQFVTATGAGNLNLGIFDPCDYCQNNPKIVTPIYYAADATTTDPALLAINYNGTGGISTLARQNNIGTTWGVAYQRSTDKLLVAANVKRHAGLGSGGLGGIYAVAQPNGTPSVSLLVDLDAAPFSINLGNLPSNAARGLPSSATLLSLDAQALTAVGKQGLGDIDLSDDQQTLWAVNLNNRSLLRIDVTGGLAPVSAAEVQEFPLAGMSGVPTCTGGVLRPWALKLYRGRGYVGAVCTAESGGTRNDLIGYVMAFDPANPVSLTTVLTIPLNYTHGGAWNVSSNGNGAGGETAALHSSRWYVWTDTYSAATYNAFSYTGPTRRVISHPVPVLSDIEFDETGAMMVGLSDRSGLQFGSNNSLVDNSGILESVIAGGDTLRAFPTATAWQLEQASDRNATQNNGQGPNGGEFYYQDELPPAISVEHRETSRGGLAVWMGRREVVLPAMDPTNFDQNGISWFSNLTGARARTGYPLYTTVGTDGTFAKGTGIGDVELLCDPAPIEIGNRVWNDVDGDGVQDAGEPGISGITVSRQGPTGTVTTVTDANGLYYFNNLRSSTAYTLTINPSGQAALNGYSLTASNTQALSGASLTSNHAISDTRDSDAVLISNLPTIYYTTGTVGQSNHGLDFGFTQPVRAQVRIINTASPVDLAISKAVTPTTFIQGNSTGVTFVFTVTNHGPGDVTSAVVTDTAPVNVTFGSWSCAIVSAGVGSVTNTCGAASGSGNINTTVTLRSGAQARFTVPATLSAAASGTVVNTAQVALPVGTLQDTTINRPDSAQATVSGQILSYVVQKERRTPDPVRLGDDITFTIRITNTGSALLTVLPLRDLYDVASLFYLSANIAPDDAINDGQLDWSDLTVSFGQDLAPGASFAVTTIFVARHDTTSLPNQVTVNMARMLLTPSQTSTATVRIEAPTGVDLASHSARYDLTRGVTLDWSTANEAEIVGFHLLRREIGGGGWVQVNPELILARQPGQATGASYTFLDPNVEFGRTYLYLVEVVDGSGATSRRELGLVVAGSRVLLPLIQR